MISIARTRLSAPLTWHFMRVMAAVLVVFVLLVHASAKLCVRCALSQPIPLGVLQMVSPTKYSGRTQPPDRITP